MIDFRKVYEKELPSEQSALRNVRNLQLTVLGVDRIEKQRE
jgi:hypothetical protein